MARSVSRPAEPSAAPKTGLARFGDLHIRVQLLLASIGLLVAALGVVFAGMNAFKQAPQPTVLVIKPEAYIEAVALGEGEVNASGSFRYVDLAAERIVFVGHPDGDNAAPWLPIEARTAPPPDAAEGRVDGLWTALSALDVTQSFIWQVIVIPAHGGPAGTDLDLTELGPATPGVIWASEPFEAGG
jgi:hypothetical protein